MAEVVVKKQWYEIVAPKSFGGQVIGEIYLANLNSAVGRILSVNLTSLTGDIRKQNYYVKFIITKVGDGKAFTEVVGYSIVPSSIKRIVRRGCGKSDFSFKTTTADGRLVQIKVTMITKSVAKKSIIAALEKKAQEILNVAAKKERFEEFMQDVIVHKLQMIVKKDLSKIYPLRVFEIRLIRIAKEKPRGEEEPQIVEAEKEPEVKEEVKEAPEKAETAKRGKKKTELEKKQKLKKEKSD